MLVIIAIVLVASVLRAPITSVGPLLGEIKNSLELSNALAGIITTIPLICFGIFALLAPKLSTRFGLNKSLLISMIILTIGIVIRSTGSTIALFSGIIIMGIGIAIGNVLIPSLIKRDFPKKIGVLMGIYTVTMNLFGALASGISVPLVENLGLTWQQSLMIWGIMSFFAIVIWIPLLNKNGISKADTAIKETKTNLLKSPLAWKITLMMGSQALAFFCLITWIPQIMVTKGLTAHEGGFMLSLIQVVSLPFTFLTSVIASRYKTQHIFVFIGVLAYSIGVAGIAFAPVSLQIFFMPVIGMANGILFSLSLLFFTIKAKNAVDAANLSGMAQAGGYLIAAVGPFVFGSLHEINNDWTGSLIFLSIALVTTLIFGLGSAKDKFVGDE